MVVVQTPTLRIIQNMHTKLYIFIDIYSFCIFNLRKLAPKIEQAPEAPLLAIHDFFFGSAEVFENSYNKFLRLNFLYIYTKIWLYIYTILQCFFYLHRKVVLLLYKFNFKPPFSYF